MSCLCSSRVLLILIHQRGGTGNAGVFAVMSKQQGDVQRAWIDACAAPTFTDLIKEGSEERRNASPDHDGVRLQEIDDASEPIRQQVQSLAYHFFGDWILEGMSPSHHFAAHGLNIAAGHFQKDGIRILRKFLT